jgi:hypothetical protein
MAFTDNFSLVAIFSLRVLKHDDRPATVNTLEHFIPPLSFHFPMTINFYDDELSEFDLDTNPSVGEAFACDARRACCSVLSSEQC